MDLVWKTKLVEMGASSPKDTVTRRVDCACHVEHPHGDGTEDSCGAFWFVTFHRRRDPQQPHMVPAGDATVVADAEASGLSTQHQQMTPATDPKVMAAAEAFEQATQQEEARLRAAAEKWVAGVASLLGLLGVAGTVTGGKPFESLPYPGKAFLVGLTLLAVVAALGAVIRSYIAAYGWPKQADVDDDSKLLEWYEGRSNRLTAAANHLRGAVVLATVALGLLAVAAMVGWLTPSKATKQMVAITLADDSTRCGELLPTQKDGQLRLRRSDTGDAIQVRTATVTSIKPVQAC